MVIINERKIAFSVCQQAMYHYYKMGDEEQAKQELWDMLVIAHGGESYRPMGGADTEYTSDGELKVTRTITEPVKSVDCKITIGSTKDI